MKKWLLICALFLAFAPMAFAEEAVPAQAPEVEAADAQLENAEPAVVEATVIATEDGLPMSALDMAIAEASAGYECPWYTIYCYQDRQCDNYCGATGAGACEFGCCACLF